MHNNDYIAVRTHRITVYVLRNVKTVLIGRAVITQADVRG